MKSPSPQASLIIFLFTAGLCPAQAQSPETFEGDVEVWGNLDVAGQFFRFGTNHDNNNDEVPGTTWSFTLEGYGPDTWATLRSKASYATGGYSWIWESPNDSAPPYTMELTRSIAGPTTLKVGGSIVLTASGMVSLLDTGLSSRIMTTGPVVAGTVAAGDITSNNSTVLTGPLLAAGITTNIKTSATVESEAVTTSGTITAAGDTHTDAGVVAGSFRTVNSTFAHAGDAVAFGSGSDARKPNSFAVGDGAIAAGDNSMAIGRGTNAVGAGQMVIGRYNIASSAPTGSDPVESDVILIVGNGNPNSTEPARIASNAMTVRLDGGTAIGAGVISSAPGQVVVGKYNDATANTNANLDKTKGVFVVGAGTSTTKKHALRILDDGTVLIQPKGDLSMGQFTGGVAP